MSVDAMTICYSIRPEGAEFGIYREKIMESGEIQSERVDGGYRSYKGAHDIAQAHGWPIKSVTPFNQ